MSKSRIELEATELDADRWTEACLTIERESEPDDDMRVQDIFMSPAEMEAVYHRLKTYYEQGIWSLGSVER